MHLVSWSEEELREAVKNSGSYAGTLTKMGMCLAGGNYKTIKKYIELYNIDTHHFNPYKHNSNKNKHRTRLKDILIENSKPIRTSSLKYRLINKGLVKEKCYVCNIEPIWNNSHLALQLDHINGVRTDNRLENLRLLCPNCHSQTKTYGGKNTQWKKQRPKNSITYEKAINTCIDCNKIINKTATRCKKCLGKSRITQKPVTKEELKNLIKNNTWVALGKRFGVSDNAVRKWAKKYEII